MGGGGGGQSSPANAFADIITLHTLIQYIVLFDASSKQELGHHDKDLCTYINH